MNIHCSDRKKREAEVFRNACVFARLQEIDLTRFPKGNVIIKNSLQKRILSGGREKIYKYHYQVVDVYGEGQFHLPVKNKERYQKEKDKRWKLRDEIIYRNDMEMRINEAEQHLLKAIKKLNSLKKSTEPLETFEKVMKRAKNAIRNKSAFEKEKKQTKEELDNPRRDPTFDVDGLIVTNLGEAVRSKNECLFADKLYDMRVPYLYEMELSKVGKPDFTVFVGEKVYFVELFGMLEKDGYTKSQQRKIEKYSEMNICVGKNLLLIDVTRGIDMRIIESIIQELIVGRVSENIVRGYSTAEYDKKMARIKAYSDLCVKETIN